MTDNLPINVKILGVKVDFLSMEEVVEKVSQWLNKENYIDSGFRPDSVGTRRNDKKKVGKKYYLVTPNPEIITYAQEDSQFKEILNRADLVIPDGAGVVWAVNKIKNPCLAGRQEKSKIKNILQRVTGIDLMLKLCELAPGYGWRIGLIGGDDKIAKKTAEVLKNKYPGIKIVLAESGGEIGIHGDRYEDMRIRIASSPLDLLFVAFGFPKQEYWIAKNVASFPARVFMPVGGAFDYISGKIKRAPLWMRKMGLEWFYRLIKEPHRLKRQLTGARFFFLVLKEKWYNKNI